MAGLRGMSRHGSIISDPEVLGYSGFIVSGSSFLVIEKNGQMDVSHLYLGLSVIGLSFAADLWSGKNSFANSLAITE